MYIHVHVAPPILSISLSLSLCVSVSLSVSLCLCLSLSLSLSPLLTGTIWPTVTIVTNTHAVVCYWCNPWWSWWRAGNHKVIDQTEAIGVGSAHRGSPGIPYFRNSTGGATVARVCHTEPWNSMKMYKGHQIWVVGEWTIHVHQ